MKDDLPAQRHDTAWKALRFFNLYRIVLSGLFSVFVITDNLPPPLGSYDRRLFSVLVFVYLLCAVGAQVAVERRLGRYTWQTFGQVLIDILAITLMMYASGGVTSGFGMLLVVTIAAGSILTPGRSALFYAAIASLAVLGEEAYSWLLFYLPAANYTHAGLLGGTYFATALLGYVLARRLRESEALAAQRAMDLASLEQLNEHIVQRMQSGIIALDRGGRVRLLNASASRLIGVTSRYEGRPLAGVAPAVAERYVLWQGEGKNSAQPLRSGAGGVDILVSFTGLGTDAAEGTLVFLEDAALMRQRAQQLKLASLGRLTASIAHEIRNPLGAISHAAQLLEESSDRNGDDQRLTNIIREHSRRMNTIIENVMNLGRRDNPVPESFTMRPWLEAFVQELRARHDLPAAAVALSVTPANVMVRMDRSQLHQVLWNLCENALRYSRVMPRLELQCALHPMTRRPYLDVIDHGGGMSKEVQEHLFEPFFTTEAGGTGLGLYIASELCESNQAQLALVENTPGGCRFRIHFAHPARQQLTAG